MIPDYVPDGGSDVGPDEQAGTYRTAVADGESHSKAVVEAVAAATGTPVIDLDPLYDVIDPDSIDHSLQTRGGPPDQMEISFRFYGCDVTVRPGEVTVSAGGNLD